jgi:hypothetical protein
MPKFFFNVRNEHWIADNQGLEMASSDDAKREAQRLARLLPRTTDHKKATIVVTDEGGATICEVTVWEP